MPQPTPRPFLLSDLMVLIAAVAGGIALQRWVETPVQPLRIAFRVNRSPAASWFNYARSKTPAYQVVSLVMGLAILRWRHPRPAIRRVLRQPGATASLAAVFALLVGYSVHEIGKSLWLEDPNGGPTFFFLEREVAWQAALDWPAPAVAGIWIAQACRGRWRPERSWVDRLGRLVGLYWLVLFVLAKLFGLYLEQSESFLFF